MSSKPRSTPAAPCSPTSRSSAPQTPEASPHAPEWVPEAHGPLLSARSAYELRHRRRWARWRGGASLRPTSVRLATAPLELRGNELARLLTFRTVREQLGVALHDPRAVAVRQVRAERLAGVAVRAVARPRPRLHHDVPSRAREAEPEIHVDVPQRIEVQVRTADRIPRVGGDEERRGASAVDGTPRPGPIGVPGRDHRRVAHHDPAFVLQCAVRMLDTAGHRTDGGIVGEHLEQWLQPTRIDLDVLLHDEEVARTGDGARGSEA